MKKPTSIWNRVVFAINILVALLLIITGIISFIPSQIVSALSVLSLVVPSESGERIGFVTTVMLSIIVFLLCLYYILL